MQSSAAFVKWSCLPVTNMYCKNLYTSAVSVTLCSIVYKNRFRHPDSDYSLNLLANRADHDQTAPGAV